MGMSHHGSSEEDQQRQRELMERFIAQAEGKAKRSYSAGRISADDDGDLAAACAADRVRNIVILRFGKPVEWIGLRPAECKQLIDTLTAKLRELGDASTLEIGRRS